MRTERSAVRVRAVASSAGTVIAEVSGTEPWRPRILPPLRGWARVALVQSRASLLRADDVAVSVEVGPRARLELLELGALLAHSARGGARACLDVSVEIEAGGRLIWLGQPLIVAAGADVSASLLASLAPDAVLLRGDAIVLGRTTEPFGMLTSRMRVTLDGRPVLDETLSTCDPSVVRSTLVSGDATMRTARRRSGARQGRQWR
jgi:urease accessory protein